jgi:hypothetical protein
MQGRNARRLEALSRRPSRSPGFELHTILKPIKDAWV